MAVKKTTTQKKAQRFFKERGIRFQYIDLREKTLSKGEFRSVAAVNGGLEGMINKECNDRDALALVTYIAEEDKLDKILENLKKQVEIISISLVVLVATQGEKSIHCRRCGERSHIVKYSLEDEKNSSNENEDTEYGRKITNCFGD